MACDLDPMAGRAVERLVSGTIGAPAMLRLATSFGLVLLASPALGQTPAPGLPPPPAERIVMRLDFAGVPGCSDPEPFILALTPLVHGWDPLAPGGRWRLVLTVKKRTERYEGTAELHRPDGGVQWTRSFPPKASCFLLLDRLAYVTADRIDPVDGPPPPSAPPSKPPEPEKPLEPEKPPQPPPVPPEPVVVPAAPPASPVRARFVPRVGVGAGADFGASWGALFGVTLEGGFQRRAWEWGGWSLMGTFRWAPQQPGIGPPASAISADVSTSLLAGNLAGCVYRAWPVTLAGCVVGELGEDQQSAGTFKFQQVHQTALFAGGGVRARIEAPLSDRLYVQIVTDVLGVAKLAGSTSQSNNVIARNFGGAAGRLGAGLGVSF
jgi:hypothetical protein